MGRVIGKLRVVAVCLAVVTAACTSGAGSFTSPPESTESPDAGRPATSDAGSATSSSTSSGSTSSSSTSPPDAGGNICTGIASAPSCEPALDVSRPSDVYLEIVKLTESVEASNFKDAGEKLRPTRDLHATTDLELDLAVFDPQWPTCNPNPPPGAPKCYGPVFANELSTMKNWSIQSDPPLDFPPGVTCTDMTAGCRKLAIAKGTTVRFARSIIRYQWSPADVHRINVTRACAASCTADELRCEASNTCISLDAFCERCEGKLYAVCSCTHRCTARSDGEWCTWAESDDFASPGSCSAGKCVPHQ